MAPPFSQSPQELLGVITALVLVSRENTYREKLSRGGRSNVKKETEWITEAV